MTLVGLQERKKPDSDHHLIVVQLRAENVGKHALCVSFTPTLKTTFGLEYHEEAPSSANGLRIWEMLPGERTEGYYDFLVKNGVQPLRIVLKTFSETQTCGGRSDSFSAIMHSRDKVELDLTGPLDSAPQDKTTPDIRPAETQSARVFMTGPKGSPPEENAINAFRDRCPQVLVTTEKTKANYVVELIPAGFRRSKNMVVVTNGTGDIIHSGSTFNLGNAAKDACAAILRDFKTAPK